MSGRTRRDAPEGAAASVAEVGTAPESPADEVAAEAPFEARAALVVTALYGELYTVATAPLED